ncbi:unnamed protein product [Pseudo-nitzschia multistriata]|uniref:Uncharacterized protein n=1 Tax=Pseudo-nitzschia multistriata TaxID=183589 RepID=A0A448YVK1_9STRA|nr:unnamed protein product [Pseudo-nitzschia multistriata]
MNRSVPKNSFRSDAMASILGKKMEAPEFFEMQQATLNQQLEKSKKQNDDLEHLTKVYDAVTKESDNEKKVSETLKRQLSALTRELDVVTQERDNLRKELDFATQEYDDERNMHDAVTQELNDVEKEEDALTNVLKAFEPQQAPRIQQLEDFGLQSEIASMETLRSLLQKRKQFNALCSRDKILTGLEADAKAHQAFYKKNSRFLETFQNDEKFKIDQIKEMEESIKDFEDRHFFGSAEASILKNVEGMTQSFKDLVKERAEDMRDVSHAFVSQKACAEEAVLEVSEERQKNKRAALKIFDEYCAMAAKIRPVFDKSFSEARTTIGAKMDENPP